MSKESSLDIYQVDAFTNEVFKGNPAAVVPLKEWLPDKVMINIALENNLAETAFFVPVNNEGADFEIRWFTPAVEIELCGHATLATAHVLFDQLGWPADEIRFETRQAGALYVCKVGDRIELNFPARPVADMELPHGFEDAHNCKPISFHRAYKNLALLENEAAVRTFVPDFDFIEAMDGDGLIITAKGEDCDCVSRYFAPGSGINEDPVTGSAHCSIIPFWAERFGENMLHARQISERSGDLFCELVGDRVKMQGDAVLYLKGRIFI